MCLTSSGQKAMDEKRKVGKMKKEEVYSILQNERKKTKQILCLKQTIKSLNSRKFDYFTVGAVQFDKTRVQGGLSINEAESFNLREITRCEKELEQLQVAEKEFWGIIDIGSLDPIEKAVLLSYYYEGLSYRKIADYLGYGSHGSVHRIAQKAIHVIVTTLTTPL